MTIEFGSFDTLQNIGPQLVESLVSVHFYVVV